MPRWPWLAALVLLHAGCTSLTAGPRAPLDDRPDFAVTPPYGFADVTFLVGEQPRVINGATDLLVELYGGRGKPTRAAIGCQGLALGHSVEVVLTVLFTGEGTTAPLARDHYVK